MDSAAQPMSPPVKSILFVCSGNICRSPALQAHFEKLVKENHLEESIYVDSCGLHTISGYPPNEMMREVARQHGVIIDHLSKPFELSNFDTFDHIYVATKTQLQELKAMAPTKEAAQKVQLVTHYDPKHRDEDIPDPLSFTESGFETVFQMLASSSEAIFYTIYQK